MPRPQSLRARLVLVAILLTLIGLAIAGGATYGSLRAFLTDRIDDQLSAALRDPDLIFNDDHHRGGPSPFDAPQERAVGLYLPNGTLYRNYSRTVTPPTKIRVGTSEIGLRGAGLYRFKAVPVQERATGQPYIAAVGIAMGDTKATLNRLLMLELGIGALALLAAGLIGWKLVAVGMKPLAEIESTAGAIAEGDLSRRIVNEDQATEVGRLGHSLNVMLGRIEQSFAEREESERRLRQFVADASHELQTPLTSVRGYAELFRRGAADRPEDLATAMRRIEAESERMGVLVDDLLLLARLDQGRPLEREQVDLGAAARELTGDAAITAPGHNFTVSVDGDVTVTGDGVRLRQIVTNLLSNARTHTPPGTDIAVSVRRMGQDVLIQVADSGPGLDPDHLERVFERFFRADPSRARTSGGTGLGLSIVAAIARAHGGEAHVESSPGAGATFTVRVPVDGPTDSAGDQTPS